MDLRGTRFSEADLRNSIFSFANLTAANFAAAHLEGCVFTDATIEEVNFSDSTALKTNFSKVILRHCSFEKTDFTGALLRETVFDNCNLSQANLAQADLSGATFIGCKLTGTQLAGADLSRTTFRESPEVPQHPTLPPAANPNQPEAFEIKAVPSPAPAEVEPIPETVVIRTNLPLGFERNGQAENSVAPEGHALQTVQLTQEELSQINHEATVIETQDSFMEAFFTPLIQENRELILESIKNGKYPNDFRVKILEGCETFREKFNLDKDAAKATWNDEFNKRVQFFKIPSRNAAA